MKASLALAAIAAATMGAGARSPVQRVLAGVDPGRVVPPPPRRRPGYSACCGAQLFRAGLPDPACSKCGKVTRG